jgi:hypothetical protein
VAKGTINHLHLHLFTWVFPIIDKFLLFLGRHTKYPISKHAYRCFLWGRNGDWIYFQFPSNIVCLCPSSWALYPRSWEIPYGNPYCPIFSSITKEHKLEVQVWDNNTLILCVSKLINSRFDTIMVGLFMESMKVACDIIFNIHSYSYSATHVGWLGERITIQIQ